MHTLSILNLVLCSPVKADNAHEGLAAQGKAPGVCLWYTKPCGLGFSKTGMVSQSESRHSLGQSEC